MGMGVDSKARGNKIFSKGHCIRKNTAAAADSHSDANKRFYRGTTVDQEVFLPLDDSLLEK
jgi:hypothetical protein